LAKAIADLAQELLLEQHFSWDVPPKESGSAKPRAARRCEGRYLLRTNLSGKDPAKLWEYYLQLTEIEQAFKELKGDLAIRPIHHQLEHRIESHMLMPSPSGYGTLRAACGSLSQGFPAFRLISFLAYCLQVTLKARLIARASGLTPRAVLEKSAAVQTIDVHLPTTDGREIVLTRYTQPEKDLLLLIHQLGLTLPEQAPPKVYSDQITKLCPPVVPTF
jgi:hypothetical protein